jgi:hypothetical protein
MNPHIVLFFYNSRGSSGSPAPHRQGKGYRGGFVGYSLVQHFLLDLQKWMALLRDTDLLPKAKGKDFSNVWLQRFEGNVTILPPPLGVSDFMSVLSDPTLERLQFQITQGQIQAWPKIRNIENRMRIEHSLAYWRHYLYSLGGPPPGSTLSSARESLTDFQNNGTAQFPRSPLESGLLPKKSFLD